MAGQKKRHHLNIHYCVAAIEIVDIVDTTENSIKAVVKRTGKAANFPRSLTQFHGPLAIIPEWLARQILCPVPEGYDRGADVAVDAAGVGQTKKPALH